MAQFKNIDNYNLYYTDTDSIYIDKPLDSKFIGPNLGQFKLENIFQEGVFLAPKGRRAPWYYQHRPLFRNH